MNCQIRLNKISSQKAFKMEPKSIRNPPKNASKKKIGCLMHLRSTNYAKIKKTGRVIVLHEDTIFVQTF